MEEEKVKKKRYERSSAIPRTCVAVSRVTRLYGYYVMDCIEGNYEIMPIMAYYRLMRDNFEIPRSRIIEKYITSNKKVKE